MDRFVEGVLKSLPFMCVGVVFFWILHRIISDAVRSGVVDALESFCGIYGLWNLPMFDNEDSMLDTTDYSDAPEDECELADIFELVGVAKAAASLPTDPESDRIVDELFAEKYLDERRKREHEEFMREHGPSPAPEIGHKPDGRPWGIIEGDES